MPKQAVTRKIIRELAEEYGLSFNEVRDIAYKAPFGLLRECISKASVDDIDSFENVQIGYFGSFFASPYRVEQLIKKNKLKKDEGSE